MKSSFCLCDVSAVFGSFSLGPINLRIDTGDYLVILGPTGCGKTSLLRCIAGTACQSGGSIKLDECNLSPLPPYKRRIGLVTQMGDLFPHMTVRENVEFGLSYIHGSRKEKMKKTDRYLDLFSLTHLARRKAGTVSGGEGRRVALARCLITEPSVLLLDEPLGMLDHNGRQSMMSTLNMIHKGLNIMTIHVTHNRHEAWHLGGRCAVMNKGRIVQEGSASDLFRAPKSKFVAEFLGGENIFSAVFSNDTAYVSWGELPLTSMPVFEKGYVVIRPERIRVSQVKNKSNFKGVVESIQDCGAFMECRVRVNGSICLVAHTGIDSSDEFRIGTAVYIDWTDNALHCIAE
ncbi:MAG: ABC transporter ATP-binding protein [Candidatus Auribacter fodinae]|uniref:ABC transporter ATP-binding protein n=1 Tax=Candidatus Auribacter fodinae TaxID=2093366 RepID=A0A3A4QZY1_9BACT|nr:MAG: ABC transporter ATP-binding protein [Candidatus Auribacter fodinae]